MIITGRHSVAQEGQLIGNATMIRPGSLRWKKDEAVGVYLGGDYTQAPLGYAMNFERTGKDIVARIDWNERAIAQGLFDEDLSFCKDWYDLFVFVTECKYIPSRKGHYILRDGLIRAVTAVPIAAIPRGILNVSS